jgi:hypothetical protein
MSKAPFKAALLLTAMALAMSAPAQAVGRTSVTRTIVATTYFQGLRVPTCSNPTSPSCEKVSTAARQARCAYLLAKDQSQDATTGKLGYVIALAAADGDGTGRFTLKDATGDGLLHDFDVFYYTALGDCQYTASPNAAVPDVGNPPTPVDRPLGVWDFEHVGNEAGAIPRGAKFAIVMQTFVPNGRFAFVTT